MGTDTDSTLDSQKEVNPIDYEGGLEVADHQQYPPTPRSTSSKQDHYYPHFSHLPPLPPITPLPSAAPERRILGLRRKTFILSASLISVVIIAVISGSVGGVLSVKNAQSQCQANPPSGLLNLATTTVTATIITPGATPTTILPSPTTPSDRVAVPTSGMLALDCPAVSGTTLGINMGPDPEARFLLQCGLDLVSSGSDILAFTAYSLTDCLRACASLNRNSRDSECKGVVFDADMAEVARRFGTCVLKRSADGQVREGDPGLVNLRAAGVLVS